MTLIFRICMVQHFLENILNAFLHFFDSLLGVVTYCKKHVCPTSAEEGLSNTFTPQNEPTSVGCYNPPLDLTPDEIKSLDGEGRAVITEHEATGGTRGEVSRRMCVFNLYCPRADREDEERFTFKMNFYKLLQARYEKIIKSGK